MNDEYWMSEAVRVAKKARCLNAKCGAVVVAGGKVIGSGYNAPPQDNEQNRMCHAERAFANKPAYDRTCCVHAEWRAILDAQKNAPNEVPGGALYFVRVDDNGAILFSGEPYCTVCSRLALDVGIETFYLWHERGITGYPTHEYNRLSYEALRR